MAITHAKHAGREVLVKAELSPGVYTTIGGCRSDGITIGNEAVDVSDKDGLWRCLLSQAGTGTVTVNSSGLLANSAALKEARVKAQTDGKLGLLFAYKSGRAIYGDFIIASFEATGEYNGAQEFTLTAESADTPSEGIAEALPTVAWDFAATKSIQPRIGSATMTFTRPGVASYVNEFGRLGWADVDEPRFEHDSDGACLGYLPEAAATNLLPWSQDFTDAGWVKQGGTTTKPANAPGPGRAGATLFTESAANEQHGAQRRASVTAGTTYSLSAFVRPNGRRYAVLDGTGAGSPGSDAAVFDLQTGAVVSAQANALRPTIKRVGGFYRIGFSVVAAATGLYALNIRPSAGPTDFGTYLGDGVSGMWLFGAQLEAGPQVTSYIRTAASAVTRAADSLSCTTASIPGFSATEGTLAVRGVGSQPQSGVANHYLASFNDGTVNNVIAHRTLPGAPPLGSGLIVTGGAGEVSVTSDAPAEQGYSRALAWEANNVAYSAGGGTPSIDSAAAIPGVSQLQVGTYPSDTPPSRPIRSVSYYNTRVSNNAVRMLTS